MKNSGLQEAHGLQVTAEDLHIRFDVFIVVLVTTHKCVRHVIWAEAIYSEIIIIYIINFVCINANTHNKINHSKTRKNGMYECISNFRHIFIQHRKILSVLDLLNAA